MTRFLTILLMCIALLFITSCIQVNTVVKVKTDGSGIVEETFLMKKDMLQQMKIMVEEMAKSMDQALTEKESPGKTQQGADSQNKAERFDIFDEAKLKERGGDMGEGVTYLKGSKIITDDYEGYRAIYAFTDINKVKINRNPGENMPSGPQKNSSGAKGANEYITFAFTKGKPAELLVKTPEGKTKTPESKINKNPEDVSKDPNPAQNNVKAQEEMATQILGMFKGIKIALAVAVDGNILETNATYREGSKITLMELDFGKLMEMPEQLKKFGQFNPKSIEEFKALLQDMPGIKVDLNNEIRIKFDQ